MSAVMTLEDALVHGRGVERPIRCPNPDHEDRQASASVNVVKGVWYCHACHTKGSTDGKRVPTTDELAEALNAMANPDQAPPRPLAWLELFGWGHYWLSRFPEWVCWQNSLGEDPLTGDATFPLNSASGAVMGVGRRRESGEPRYLYPRGWSASSALWSAGIKMRLHDIVALTEGAADACALREVGITAYGCYGAGLHAPQREQVAALNPRLVLLAFDADEAGERAAAHTAALLTDLCETARIDWSRGRVKDPAEARPGLRLELAARTVSGSAYGRPEQAVRDWAENVRLWTSAYAVSREE